MIFGTESAVPQDSNNQESRDNNGCMDVIIIENNDERMERNGDSSIHTIKIPPAVSGIGFNNDGTWTPRRHSIERTDRNVSECVCVLKSNALDIKRTKFI